MIKKLRIKFIIVAMVAITIVLFTIIGAINISNRVDIVNDADEMLELLSKNDGKFPIEDVKEKEATEPSGTEPPSEEKPLDDGKKMPDDMSPEAPYETRYFTVTTVNGEVTKIDIENIAAVDEESAESYMTTASNKSKDSGFIDNYRYLVTTNNDGSTLYIFLDCTKDLDTFNAFLRASFLISVVGLVIVFILVYVMSLIIVKPVVESYKKQKQFITDANHELKTPLTVINASCDILEMDGGENEWTTSIKDQVARLTDLTNKLVMLSRMDEEDRKTQMTDFSLSEVIRDTVKPYDTIAESENKKFTYIVQENVTLNGDMSMIKQMLSLLLDNAFKYSDSDGNIELTLTESGKAKKIVIKNSTDGVPTGNLNMLFERFYRLDSSRNSETGGSGIGLSVVQAIVEQHKGKITAESPDGKEIIFTITL